MTTRTSFALVALLIIAGRTQGGGVDKAKLRELATLPTVSICFGTGFSSLSGLVFGDSPDHSAEIARLQIQMKGDPSDAERYLLLARHYGAVKREKEWKEASAKAVAICRQQVREHPGDIGWLVRLGEALDYSGETKEAEKLLRRAVNEAPNDWHAWLALADCVDGRSFQAIFGDKGFPFTFHNEKLIFPTLLERKPTAEQIEEMRRIAQEAHGYHDRAIDLAPRDEAKPYSRRYSSNWFHGIVEAGLRTLKGERFNPTPVFLAPECLADIRQIARRSPDDPQVIGSAMCWEILACVNKNELEMKTELSSLADYRALRKRSLLDVLPLERRTFVRWCLENLERLTKHAEKVKAAAAAEILADCLMTIDKMGEECGASFSIPARKAENTAVVVHHLRRAVRLDPSRERAWDFLTLLLNTENKNEAEAIAIARKRLEIKDNAANRFLLAKVYDDDKQFDKAAEQLQSGLKSDPTDLKCRFGLIALALQREDAQSLKEAGEQLDALQPRIKETKSRQIWLDYHHLCGIQYALADHPDWAMAEFQKILHGKKGDAAATRALVALGKPLEPADQQLAIDYIKERGGSVAGKDSQTASPVERIALTGDSITDEDLFVLTAFPQLRELDLSGTSITDAGLAGLKELTALRRLVLYGTKITDKGVISLKAMQDLRDLSLSETGITDAGLAHLEGLPNLERLKINDLYELQGKTKITDAGLVHLSKLPKLDSVSVGSSITDKGLTHLAAVSRLRSLSMLSSQITDEGMKQLERLTEIEVLSLSDAPITDAGLTHLKVLRNLKKLHLDGTKITDAGMVQLKELSRLEELELDGTAISDGGLVQLRGLTNLRKLNLGDSDRKGLSAAVSMKPPLTGVGLKHLQGLSKLKSLTLSGRPVTDVGLSEIEQLTQIEYLSLCSSRISDAGLAHLQHLKHLQVVNLRDTKITTHGITELRKALPKVEVYR